MNDQTDSQLLGDWAETRSEPAFAELVRRHVDFVHSAALRMVCDSHLAKDVTQSVFVALARDAARITDCRVLAGWLHRTAQNIAAQTVRTDVRRRAREQEAATMNELLADSGSGAGVSPAWSEIAPHLDAALGELSEPDRDAVLLRYFENKSLKEVGAAPGFSEDAAQKRVSRAAERLREFFAKRGVTVGASGLVVVISANAVQAAPVGLAVTISTAAATLAGTTIVATATATATKVIAMTTLQKAIITAALAVVAGVGIYEARQASSAQGQVQTLQQQQAPLAEQIQQLTHDRDAATAQLAALRDEIERLNRNKSELLKLRSEVGLLRVQLETAKKTEPKSEQPPLTTAKDYYTRADHHKMNREYDAALEDLNKAIELDPNMAEAYMDRGDLYALYLAKDRGGYEKAVADRTRCLEIDPKNWIALSSRASELQQLKRYDEAITDWTVIIEGDLDFTRAVEGKTNSIAKAFFLRGAIFQTNKRDYAKAVADYTTALQLDPNISGAHRFRGECYEMLGKTEMAQQDFAIEPKGK